MLPLLGGLYICHKAPNLSWKELQYGLNKLYINESGVSQYASEALTLDSCDKQVELASLSTQELFNAHELLYSLTQNTNTKKDPSKAWIHIFYLGFSRTNTTTATLLKQSIKFTLILDIQKKFQLLLDICPPQRIQQLQKTS